jgi:hypothetical protein
VLPLQPVYEKALTDPLGTLTPRIMVQVKHRDQKVNVRDVRELRCGFSVRSGSQKPSP